MEELNTALETGGLRIGQVNWAFGTENADFRIPTADDLHFRLSGDINTRELQFVLQLQVTLNALYRNMLSVDESSNLLVFHKPLLSLKRLPFVSHTTGYRKIMENVRQAEQKDYSMDVLLEEFFRSERMEKSEGENSCETLKRERVSQELQALTKLGTALINVALAVVRMSRSSAGPRWRNAEELFWNGEYEAALAVLELPKIKTELRKAAHENDRTTVENLIGEALLRIRLLQVDKPDWGQTAAWKKEITSIYKTCITCGHNCLTKKAYAGLMTEYAVFLVTIGQDRRSWILYEHVLPEWRTLAEEDPDTCLPELASALHHYAHLLAYSYTLITTDPTGEKCYDEVFRNSTSEASLQEVLEIYRLLAKENPDAVLPQWAEATFHYGKMLLSRYYAQRALQAFSEALDLYRLLAERHPGHYESLLEARSNNMLERIHHYSSFFEDESVSEDVRELQSEAEHDNPEAQFQLGKLYEHGDGVIRDYDEAEKWYARAAENGHMEAQRCMGMNCLEATLGRRDMTAAEKWFRMAAMQGDETSQLELAKICMVRKDMQGYEEALYWLHEAAEKEESGEACFLLGQCYELALGVPQSYEQAAYWYQKGSDNFSNMDCFYHLGHLYHHGKGVPQDYDKALHCYEEVRFWGFEHPDVQKKIEKLLEEMDG